MAELKIAVLGAGVMGQAHADRIAREPTLRLAGLVDPHPGAPETAARHGARAFPTLAELIAADRPDGVVIATPNALHVSHGWQAFEAGLPMLIEKPLADDIAGAEALVEAAEAARLPILVGHPRRYNPLIDAAKAWLDAGRLGRVVGVEATVWLMKPDAYFEPAWRRAPGAGPLLINAIHEIDLLRWLCGEIVAVSAFAANAARGHEVEDSASALLRFENGALGTLNVSDAIASPWSWELTAGENPIYPRQPAFSSRIGGTHGALSIPDLVFWSHPGERGWTEPMTSERLTFAPEDPLSLQLRHFRDVIRRRARPRVSGRDGLGTLKVLDAIKRSAATGQGIQIS